MLIETIDQGKRINLCSPTDMPQAASFLWNHRMMLHMNCMGYTVSQFMQPEPAKYAHAPNLEAKTFMQPEQPYYAHHTGRFCYIKDLDNERLFSVPYAPVKSQHQQWCFSAGQSDLYWIVKENDLEIKMSLHLTREDLVELWTIEVRNQSSTKRNIQVIPYFPVGYMSWMNQSASFDEEVNGIICHSVSPYQKYQDYDKIKKYKDKTFLLSDVTPDAYEAKQEAFEGQGGLHNPSSIANGSLGNGEAIYETPTCALQFDLSLEAKESKVYKFVFGPAIDKSEIKSIKKRYLDDENGFKKAFQDYDAYVNEGIRPLKIKTPDPKLDNFVNFWLKRQIYYHGETNRLSTDPQTRNYLQDNMGMGYIKPKVTRAAFKTALSQQAASGAMPDGILIVEGAELKYINQVPHTDHCVWLPVCLKAYLDETNDYDFLNEVLPFADSKELVSVAEHIHRAMHWLLSNRDSRGLNFINQGDWCDPMNMVGYKGKGVSGWLSLATSYALQVWVEICDNAEMDSPKEVFLEGSKALNEAVNQYLWDGNWYGRGITDDDVVFGISKDMEGKIFLNPQAWALLSNTAENDKLSKVVDSVSKELETPYGVEMLCPSFTAMREDVGRVTQKHPGSAENGSVYNHAAAFYIYALYQKGLGDDAYRLIDKMIAGSNEQDLIQRGQLPVFIPNYYRGAFKQFPRTAGRSSQLFNTGTVHWILRSLIDGLFGLKGEPKGLRIEPQLPKDWDQVEVTRVFRGATFEISMGRNPNITSLIISNNGDVLDHNLIENIEADKVYVIKVEIPQ